MTCEGETVAASPMRLRLFDVWVLVVVGVLGLRLRAEFGSQELGVTCGRVIPLGGGIHGMVEAFVACWRSVPSFGRGFELQVPQTESKLNYGA